MHYASEYYDPVKAREYYLRTRELKGRSSAGMSKEQKEALAVTNDGIRTAKKGALDKASTDTKTQLDSLQASAEAARARIEAKLTSFLAQLNGQTPIPANASPKLRAFMKRQRAAHTAAAKKSARAELQQVGTELKAAVQAARDAYAATKKSVVEKYDTAAQTEYDNIRTQIK